MIIRLLLLLLAIAPLKIQLQAGIWKDVKSAFAQEILPAPPMIKVLIVHDQPGIVIEVKGKYSLYDPRTNEHISTRFVGKRKYLQALQGGLKWGEEFPGLYQLTIVPADQSVTTVVNGIEYRGSVYIYDIGGTLSVVNEVYIEDYLASLLTPQFTEPLEKEALAAVAIASRTNAYYEATNGKNPFWAVDGRKIGYEGHFTTSRRSAIEVAIQSTAFMVLSKKDAPSGQAYSFPALWGSGTGGKSADAQAVFSRISLYDTNEMAQKGADASKILSKAFPDTKIVLMRYMLAPLQTESTPE